MTYTPYKRSDSAGSTAFRDYALVDTAASVRRLQNAMTQHAVLVWIVLPIFVLLEAFVPVMAVSCATGYANWTILVVVLLEAHHCWAEHQAWTSLRELLTPPERTIMRQLGIARSRRKMVVLGVLEEIDLYTDISFPLIARACDAILTLKWLEAWEEVPIFGDAMVAIITIMRFWGFATLLAISNVGLTGLAGLYAMHAEEASPDKATDPVEGVSGRAFFTWAKAAETSMMPSVALICNEMATQRRYRLDENKDAGAAAQAREDAVMGKLDAASAREAEMIKMEEVEKLDAEEKVYFFSLLFVKVFLGNLLQLWLQGSFFALTFTSTGTQAKVKVLVSMAISGLQAVARVWQSLGRLGLLGCFNALMVILALGWVGAKVYFAFKCEDHLWNLTTGCVTF